MSERFLCINKDDQGAFSISLVNMFGEGVGVGVSHLTTWSGGKETIFMKWILDTDQLRSISRLFKEEADQCDPKINVGSTI